jgi:hypothetical protein
MVANMGIIYWDDDGVGANLRSIIPNDVEPLLHS